MGNGIAHCFAQSDYKVNLIDLSQDQLEKALSKIATNLDRMVLKGKIQELDKKTTLQNIKTYTDVKSGVQSVDLVIEAATENIDVKLKIFKELDEICDPKTILGTDTSSICSAIPNLFA